MPPRHRHPSGLPANFLARFLARNLDWLADNPGPAGLVAVVMAALILIRAGLFPGTGGDDGEQLIFSQYMAWGYQVRNPPLYTWLVAFVSLMTGPNLWALNIVKFGLLGAFYGLMWRACSLLFVDKRVAALAALSPVLFYYAAWEVVTGFSHTVLAATLYAAAFLQIIRLRNGGGPRDFLLLGLVMGLGGQAKYAFWLFFLSLFIAALTDREARRHLLRPGLIVSVLVAAALLAPHYAWLWDHFSTLAQQAEKAPGEAAAGRFAGLGHALRAAGGFVLPFALVAAACFPAALRRAHHHVHPMARVVGLQIVLVLAATAVMALVAPDFRVRTHYMFVLVLLPVWLLLRAEATSPTPTRLGVYGLCVSLCLLAAPVGMVAKFLFEPFTCERCQHHIPYGVVARALRDAGFQGGTIVAYWHPDPLPGNLRARLPEARVISLKHPDIIPPLRPQPGRPGQCLVVWSADSRHNDKATAIAGANKLLHAGIPADAPHQVITAPMPVVLPWAPRKSAQIGLVLTPGRGDCR